MEIYYERPENEADRQAREMAVYDLLDGLQVPYARVDHEAAMTIDDCKGADTALDIEICKNLFLCNRQETNFYLLMMPGKKKFVTRDLCKQINSPRLSFAKEEYMLKLLNLHPGSVSILGLMYDTENRVQLLMDREVVECEYLGCHPCVNTSSLRLRTADVLEKILPAIHHGYQVVDL